MRFFINLIPVFALVSSNLSAVASCPRLSGVWEVDISNAPSYKAETKFGISFSKRNRLSIQQDGCKSITFNGIKWIIGQTKVFCNGWTGLCSDYTATYVNNQSFVLNGRPQSGNDMDRVVKWWLEFEPKGMLHFAGIRNEQHPEGEAYLSRSP